MSTTRGTTGTLIKSQKFNSPDADLVIRSEDNVQFRIHSKALSFLSGGFPDRGTFSNATACDDIVLLPESSEVLELMFQFIYPQRFPDLRNLPFEVVSQLAEAVEKYEIYPGMRACALSMEHYKEAYPMKVLGYASKHGHIELVNVMGPFVIGQDMEIAFSKLPLQGYAAWTRYVGYWQRGIRYVLATHIPTPKCPKNDCGFQFGEMVAQMKRDIIDALPEGKKLCTVTLSRASVCDICFSVAQAHLKVMQTRIKEIPQLGDLLFGKV